MGGRADWQEGRLMKVLVKTTLRGIMNKVGLECVCDREGNIQSIHLCFDACVSNEAFKML